MNTIIIDTFFDPILPETSTDLAKKTCAIFEEYQENIRRTDAGIEARAGNWRGRNGGYFSLLIPDDTPKDALKETARFVSKLESTSGVSLKATLNKTRLLSNEIRITIIELGLWFGMRIASP